MFASFSLYWYCSMNIDVWKAVADLCNVVAALDISHVKLYDQKKDSKSKHSLL